MGVAHRPVLAGTRAAPVAGDLSPPSGLACSLPELALLLGVPPPRWSRPQPRPLRPWRALPARPATGYRAGRCGHTAHGTVDAGSAWPLSRVCAGVLVSGLGVWLALLGPAPSLTASLDRAEVEALPSPRVVWSRWSSVRWPPPTSHATSRGTSHPAYTRSDGGCGPPGG
jgi:hypothetical protein